MCLDTPTNTSAPRFAVALSSSTQSACPNSRSPAADGVIVSDIGRNSLLMLNLFSTFALLLSGVLVGSSVASMMARQVREIGVMKTVGATSGQIAGMHLAMMLGLGVGALVLKATAPGYVQ